MTTHYQDVGGMVKMTDGDVAAGRQLLQLAIFSRFSRR
jgi:hypothetical protein